MVDFDDSFTNRRKTVRDRASESLDDLRYALDSPVSSPTTNESYSRAVSRLKHLLQRYNNFQQREPLPSTSLSTTGEPSIFFPDPDELTELLNRHYSVVRHLQGKVDFLKDALGSLKQKTKTVCKENQSLFEQLKSKAIGQLMNHKDFEGVGSMAHRYNSESNEEEGARNGEGLLNVGQGMNDRDDETTEWYPVEMDGSKSTAKSVDDQLFLSSKERKFVKQMDDEVNKIRHLHEGKTKQLESLLYAARDDIEEYVRHIARLEDKLRARESFHIAEHPGQPVLCVKCGHQEAVLSSTHGDALTKTLEKLKRERDELMGTLTSQNSSIAKARKRELDAYTQVKKSCEMAEQSQLQKAEAIIQVQQLRQELKQQKERYDKYVTSAKERAATDQDTTRSEYLKQMDTLNSKIREANDERVTTENQLERLTREKVALLSELEQAKTQILANAADISKVGQDKMNELTEAQVKLSLAKQEMSSLKNTLVTSNRQRDQEKTRLTAEMGEVRRRLEEAEKGWMEDKEECLRLTEKLDNTERDVKMANAARAKIEEARTNDVKMIRQQARNREQHVTGLLQEAEKRHAQVRAELEHMLESQLQISDRLKEECRNLSQQLQDTSAKSRAVLRGVTQENDKNRAEITKLTSKCKDLENRNQHKDKQLNKLNSKITLLENYIKKYTQQIYELLVKQNTFMKDRHNLTREVDYWRQKLLTSHKLDGVTHNDTESNANLVDDVDSEL